MIAVVSRAVVKGPPALFSAAPPSTKIKMKVHRNSPIKALISDFSIISSYTYVRVCVCTTFGLRAYLNRICNDVAHMEPIRIASLSEEPIKSASVDSIKNQSFLCITKSLYG